MHYPIKMQVKYFSLSQYLVENERKQIRLPSNFMPTLRHFWNRQYGHLFRWLLSIWQLRLSTHEYTFLFCTVRLKNPENKTVHCSCHNNLTHDLYESRWSGVPFDQWVGVLAIKFRGISLKSYRIAKPLITSYNQQYWGHVETEISCTRLRFPVDISIQPAIFKCTNDNTDEGEFGFQLSSRLPVTQDVDFLRRYTVHVLSP